MHTPSLPCSNGLSRTDQLGRGVVVLPGSDVPPPWSACTRVIVGDTETGDPAPTVDVLHGLWLARRPVVIELAVDPDTLRAPQRHDGPVHGLDPSFEFPRERLQFLVWANTYDARHGDPMWWHGRKAARLFADEGVNEGARRTSRWLTAHRSRSTADRSATPARGVAVVHRWNAEAGSARRAGHPCRRLTSPPTSWPRSTTARGGPRDRPGRFGQDPGADRTAPPSRRRPRRDPGPSPPWPTTPRLPNRCRSAAPTCSRRTGPTSAPSTASGSGSATGSDRRRLRVLEEPGYGTCRERVRDPAPGQHRHRRPLHRGPVRSGSG